MIENLNDLEDKINELENLWKVLYESILFNSENEGATTYMLPMCEIISEKFNQLDCLYEELENKIMKV